MDRLRNFGFLIKDLSRLYTKLFEEHARDFDVTLPQCKALVYLSKNESISQIRLAELTDIDPMTLVRILDRMEADEWIERRAHPTDRRARQLHLKAKAKPVLERIWKVGDQVRAQVFAGFSAAEREQFLSLLERAHTNLVDLKPATVQQEKLTENPVKERVAVTKASTAKSSARKASVQVTRKAVRSTR